MPSLIPRLLPVARLSMSAWLALLPTSTTAAPTSSLSVYQGSWKVTWQGADKPDDLKNDCATMGRFFACQQTVNGEVSSLLLLIATEDGSRYITQTVMPNGRARGTGALQVTHGPKGDVWTFTSSWNQGGGSTTHYRTTNQFTGRDRIHFTQEESNNEKDWKTTGEGETVRTGH